MTGASLALCMTSYVTHAAAQESPSHPGGGTNKGERTSSLSWVRLEGAESCIATNALAQAVEERLQRKVFVSASQADVSVEGTIKSVKKAPAPNQGEWRAVITMRDAKGTLLGTRQIDRAASTCSDLDEAIVFVVSVMIDPNAALAPKKPPPPPPPPTVVIQREQVPVPVPVPVPVEPPRPWTFEGHVGFTASLGLLPTVGWGGSASVLLEPPGFWGIQLSGTDWANSTAEADRGAKSNVSLAYGGLALCPLFWESGRYSYRGCLGVEVGSLQSRGEGFDTPANDEALAVHAFLPNRFALRIAGPLEASFGLTLIVPLVRSELSYRAADGTDIVIFRASPIAGATDLSMGLRFP